MAVSKIPVALLDPTVSSCEPESPPLVHVHPGKREGKFGYPLVWTLSLEGSVLNWEYTRLGTGKKTTFITCSKTM